MTLEARALPAAASPTVAFHLLPPGRVPAYDEVLPGESLAHVDHGEGSALSVVRRREGPGHDGPGLVDVCFHGVALATVDCGSFDVWLTLAPEADPGLASVLISGTLMSVVLILRGHPVLHASAVVVGEGEDRGAIAMVGRSGMGKSTMATVLCRDGAELLADDVLRTDLREDGSVWAWPGATATRLSGAAESLAHQAGDQVSVTADGRFTAALPLAPAEPVPLLALVVPHPDRAAQQVGTTRLQGVEALLALLSFPRILGWTEPMTSGVAHHHWGELARRVPVVSVSVPWGPPFIDGLGGSIVAGVLAARADLGGGAVRA